MNLICSRCGTESTHVLNLGHYHYVCASCKALLQADVTRGSGGGMDLKIAPALARGSTRAHWRSGPTRPGEARVRAKSRPPV